MAHKKRLIDVDNAKKDFNLHFGGVSHAVITNKILDEQPTVDAVEVAKIEEVKQEILQVLDNLIDVSKPLAYWSVNDSSSYYSGKIQALEVARRLVNAALTDVCGAKMDGGNEDA